MKPRFNSDRASGRPFRNQPSGTRPSARDLMSDSRMSRSETSLYLILTAAALMAFAQHVQVAHRFVQKLPEIASAVAVLFRDRV